MQITIHHIQPSDIPALRHRWNAPSSVPPRARKIICIPPREETPPAFDNSLKGTGKTKFTTRVCGQLNLAAQLATALTPLKRRTT
jgi:hypothetical protein